MAVYRINGAKIMTEQNKINKHIDDIFKETGRANLLIDDLKKWGNRVYNLTIAEIVERFDKSYDESEGIVRKYFEGNNLPINHKFHFSKNIYDYPILK